jgi:hypothetical protein
MKRNARTSSGVWRHVLHWISLIFAPFNSSAEDLLRCGVGFVNRIWEVVDLNLVYGGACGAWRRFQNVWVTCAEVEFDRKTWVFLIFRSGTDLCDQFVESLKFCDEKGLVGCCEEWCGRGRIEMARESFRTLIPYRKPKSNDNGKYKREIEREEENGG